MTNLSAILCDFDSLISKRHCPRSGSIQAEGWARADPDALLIFANLLRRTQICRLEGRNDRALRIACNDAPVTMPNALPLNLSPAQSHAQREKFKLTNDSVA